MARVRGILTGSRKYGVSRDDSDEDRIVWSSIDKIEREGFRVRWSSRDSACMTKGRVEYIVCFNFRSYLALVLSERICSFIKMCVGPIERSTAVTVHKTLFAFFRVNAYPRKK